MSAHRIYHSLGNADQLFGCDRELFLFNLIFCTAVCMMSFDLTVFIASSLVFGLNFGLLYTMGKKDIWMRHIYVRQLHYYSYYLAQPHLHCSSRRISRK
ncbi:MULTISPECIES: VirB3 family type IV secretion system protein [unclassified Anaerobiospirillum]|uniref:VirB3 family type IV secretion system protein n=1 Tax=unclassified Anaerobiospirillum TaxID=2647410 RepID=UPI001FF0F859|nr:MULTISPECIES: VirB3 family type IV secretion system protein [unclassified Anaerobiospirillum]MCK0525837.1 VirB3 family type IV secretion system protein [Anaerobiospirillum sp. NML120449]MCK0535523.1 VirB3 family type IV secretion system protein [Anaerobiospirillum sp. NML120511]MCK0540720.1 VirB3 family type IV secretion system protein [Anaerobiospirillum sp. NML02-A-032]